MRTHILASCTILFASCLANPQGTGESESSSGTDTAGSTTSGSTTDSTTGSATTGSSSTDPTGSSGSTTASDSTAGSSGTSSTAMCLDGICDEGEAKTCPEDCEFCGNGKMERGEACDDGNKENTDSCTDKCKMASCPDGYVQGAEECDDGAETSTCNLNCTMAVCGDGVLNSSAGETCDDGNVVASDGCDASCKLECLVFVTNGIFTGDLGGLEGADAKCAAAAAAKDAELYGAYRAWLSDSNSSAATRLTACPAPITLRDGTVVANSWADFIAADHLVPISKDEYNSDPEMTVPQHKVWTGGEGGDQTFNCMGWHSVLNQNLGTFGSHNVMDSAWMNEGANLCSLSFHLYCVQQQN